MVIFRYLAIGWFLFCVTVMLVLVLSDHWLAFAVALSPLPSLLVPVSLVWLLILLGIRRRLTPWALAALLSALLLTPFELAGWPNQDRLKPIANGRDVDVARAAPATEISILSANVGERDRSNLLEFVDLLKPDIIATQAGDLSPTVTWLAHFHYLEVGRFALRSRWTIVAAEPIRVDNHLVAARFEVAWPPEPLTIYVIHLPTPRDAVGDLRGRGILRPENREQAAAFQRRKWQMLRTLSKLIAEEPRPLLLVGDANQPAMGPAYRQLNRHLQDGHSAAGWGFGYTIPGMVNSRFFRYLCPWARIDYVLAGNQLKFIEHRTEPSHPGQHRAVFARLQLVLE